MKAFLNPFYIFYNICLAGEIFTLNCSYLGLMLLVYVPTTGIFKMGQTRPLFVYFILFTRYTYIAQNLTTTEKA